VHSQLRDDKERMAVANGLTGLELSLHKFLADITRIETGCKWHMRLQQYRIFVFDKVGVYKLFEQACCFFTEGIPSTDFSWNILIMEAATFSETPGTINM
jgi:hypothetical protein